MNDSCSENTTNMTLEEAVAYLRTLANFGGTLIQSRELAQKGLGNVHHIRRSGLFKQILKDKKWTQE